MTPKQLDRCAYPPVLASDVEVSPRSESTKPSFVIGSASAGRYLLLGVAEHRVVQLLDGKRAPSAMCEELHRRHGCAPPLAGLIRFLTKLEEAGILDGTRAGAVQQAILPGNQLYLRWSLFNPDPLFARLLPLFRWIWTPWFFAASILLMTVAACIALVNRAEVLHYGALALREHYLSVFLAAWLVTVTHEFAHGMTSKAFGGRATEVGALLVYYCLPALYCNVSGIHMIPQRGRRLWVIAAGIYWQLMVGASAMLAWFLFHPQTLPAAAAMALVLGSLLDLIFNINPLIKLDGYYFLSQWLRMPNLMDRSRARWRAFFGEQKTGTQRFTSRESRILLVFGFCSFLHNLALPLVIVWYAAQYLMDWFGFAGLLLSAFLGLAYCWSPIKKFFERKGGRMTTSEPEQHRLRRLLPAAIGLCLLILLLFMPWTASVGSYGVLVAIPGREAIVRAAESASLTAVNVEPGEDVSRGATIGQMGNLDVEDQLAQVRADLARVNAEVGRLRGELLVQQETAVTSEWQLAQRRREFNEVDREVQQIQSNLVLASSSVPVSHLPAALAVLEANAEQARARLAEADRQRDRVRTLFKQGIVARSVLDGAEAGSSALAFNLAAANERLNAALVEHRRHHTATETEVHVANSRLSAGRAQAASLSLQLDAARRLRESLAERLILLERKRALFVLVAPVAGTVLGDDLPRMVGQYFAKGAEICRIVDTRELLVRVQVAEEALGDIAPGQTVRVKTRAFPDRVFRGSVARIGGDSELDPNGQRSYRVELRIQNEHDLLKTGMSVFVRVEFGRHAVAWILGHKLKQALRPELWML